MIAMYSMQIESTIQIIIISYQFTKIYAVNELRIINYDLIIIKYESLVIPTLNKMLLINIYKLFL